MPSRKCREGDLVFVRATVLEACSDGFKVLIHDGIAINIWLPVSEIARQEDIHLLRPLSREHPPKRR